MARRFDFRKLLPKAIAFVSHGGQNSMMQGLLNGVPLIVCPSGIFERRYNARSVARLHAGVNLELDEFGPERIRHIVSPLPT